MNNQDNSKNKVYINPNFNRPHTKSGSSNGSMHVNPKFSYLVPSVHCNVQNKNKIYINPNFINYKSTDRSTNNQIGFKTKEIQPLIHTFTEESYITYQQEVTGKTIFPEASVSQSRYSLVRQNLTNKPSKEPTIEKPKITFKVNKYKTVSWKDAKIHLNKDKSASYLPSVPNIDANFQTPQISRRKNVFKVVNSSNVSSFKLEKTIVHTDIQRKPYKSNYVVKESRIKRLIKGNLKKNNIPCPLFRKFGKCLRNARGSCEFLHDKKHVSICRKFIKGICHDKECLLSHDLTSKKMPTCYFYLQGTCTKAECPYLHVKLNEKAKICSDFLKGYCEKGSACLQRHVNLPLERNIKTISTMRKKKFTKIKTNGNSIIKLQQDENKDIPDVDEKTNTNRVKLKEKGERCSEHRYYEENKGDNDSNETCEIIKPTRCKLGTLPSFIQL